MFDPPKGRWEILPVARGTPQDRRFELLDRTDLEQFLRQYLFDYGVMLDLRQLLALSDPVSRFTDDEVIDTIAWRLATKELVIRQADRKVTTPSPGSGDGDEDAKPTPAPSLPDAPASAAPPAEEPEPSTFGPGTDGQAQAAALTAAAAQGSPFCQQCQNT
jgi:hypothetical protein